METEAKEIKKGTSLPVILPGLGTAGFQWSFQVSDTSCVVVRPYDGTIDTMEEAGGLINEEAFMIDAKAPGKSTVTFEQRRAWEKEAQPLNARTFEITVI